MAKAMPAEPLALEALARLLAEPGERVLHGSKSAAGVFAGASASEKAAGRLCLDNGWLEATGEYAGNGKTRKELYRVTPAGVQVALERTDPSKLLQGLADSLKTLDSHTTGIPRAVEERVTVLIRHLDGLKADVQKALAEALQPMDSVRPVLQALQTNITSVLAKAKPIDVEELTRKLAAPNRPVDAVALKTDDWAEEIMGLLTEQKQRNAFQRVTLPQIFERLRARRPNLTLGQFHDGLRRLQDEKRIRLSPYTQALATLDDPRNALFLDREVKFYAELP